MLFISILSFIWSSFFSLSLSLSSIYLSLCEHLLGTSSLFCVRRVEKKKLHWRMVNGKIFTRYFCVYSRRSIIVFYIYIYIYVCSQFGHTIHWCHCACTHDMIGERHDSVPWETSTYFTHTCARARARVSVTWKSVTLAMEKINRTERNCLVHVCVCVCANARAHIQQLTRWQVLWERVAIHNRHLQLYHSTVCGSSTYICVRCVRVFGWSHYWWTYIACIRTISFSSRSCECAL